MVPEFLKFQRHVEARQESIEGMLRELFGYIRRQEFSGVLVKLWERLNSSMMHLDFDDDDFILAVLVDIREDIENLRSKMFEMDLKLQDLQSAIESVIKWLRSIEEEFGE